MWGVTAEGAGGPDSVRAGKVEDGTDSDGNKVCETVGEEGAVVDKAVTKGLRSGGGGGGGLRLT